jgi:hypothetical protein
MIYITLNNQTIFDVVINTTNDLDNVYSLILSNSGLTNIESVSVGTQVTYEKPATIPASVNAGLPNIVLTEDYYSQNNQSVYDICLQTYGSLNLLYKLIQDSNFSSIDSYPDINTLFIFAPQKVTNKTIRNYIINQKIIFATA